MRVRRSRRDTVRGNTTVSNASQRTTAIRATPSRSEITRTDPILSSARSSLEVKAQKREPLPDDLAGRVAVVKHVKGVRRLRVVHDRDRQIAREGLCHEPVERLVQGG